MLLERLQSAVWQNENWSVSVERSILSWEGACALQLVCVSLSGPPLAPLSMGRNTLHDSRSRQQPRAQCYRASNSCVTLNAGGLASIVVPQDVMASAQRVKGITIAKMRDMTCWGIMRGDFFREEHE